MTRLYLIRHGETDYNCQGLLCGWSDPPLNDRGRRQAEGLAKSLSLIIADAYYTSGMKRTIETAAFIYQGDFTIIEDLMEINFGEFEGLRIAEIERDYPHLYKKLEEDFVSFEFPSGESLLKFHHRVIAAIDLLLKRHKNETIFLVTHSGVIRCILSHYIAGDIKKHWSFKIDYAAITILDIYDNENSVLVKLNDVTK